MRLPEEPHNALKIEMPQATDNWHGRHTIKHSKNIEKNYIINKAFYEGGRNILGLSKSIPEIIRVTVTYKERSQASSKQKIQKSYELFKKPFIVKTRAFATSQVRQ